MDYEKKYNEALERAKKFEEKYGGGYAEYIFPELAENEDERIRKHLIEVVELYWGKTNDPDKAKDLAYLEKQKEKSEIPIMGGDTDTYFDDLRMTTKPLTSREWFDEGIKYAQKLQKEQKPVEYLDKDKVYAIMTKLTILSYSKLIPINSDEFKKLHEITSDVRSLLDYPIKQKPSFSCGHENDAEWSEEDESCWNLIWDILDGSFTASKEGYKKAAAWFLQNCPKGTKLYH